MKIGFYPGCSLTGTAQEYNHSVLAMCGACDVLVEQVPDWNCCGATSAHNLNASLALSLPARILVQAEAAGMTHLLVPCAACYNRLASTHHELGEDAALRKSIGEIVGTEYKGTVQVMNVLEFITQYIAPMLPGKIKKPFAFKTACYYGCLLVRPHKVASFDRPEDPQSMDGILKELGAEPIDWAMKTECCGASLTMARPDVVGKLSGKIVEDASDRGAEVLVVACPMCHSNLDMRRPVLNTYLKQPSTIPVVYVTQAIGYSLGMDDRSLEFFRHFVPVKLPQILLNREAKSNLSK